MKATDLKTRINEVIEKSILVAWMEENHDVQLRQAKNAWYMISPKTGIHSVNENDLNERVQAHWNGFKFNQTKN